MHKLKYLSCIVLTAASVQFAVGQHISRKTEAINQNWTFHLGHVKNANETAFDDGSWRKLNLPHDWSIEGSFSKDHPATPGGGALPGGTGWYRKSFTVPAASKGKTVFIDFDGVYRNSEVWINGHYLGKRPNGYISFRYDISDYLNYGKDNVLSVKVDNSEQPNSRWYSGSGIYRSVWLTTTGNVFVDQYGSQITTPQVTEANASVVVKTTINNKLAMGKKVTLKTSLVNAQGKVVAQQSSVVILSAQATEFTQNFKVDKPALWSDKNPNLYKAVIKIVDGKTELDAYTSNFGIRYFNFDKDKGFTLNGKPLKIKGVCNHHDLGALGSAFNVRATQRQLELLKEMGCNGIRTSHNPPAPQLLDLCDQMGFIVMDEAFDMWKKGKNKFDYSLDWDKWHVQDLKDQVKRDRNHPSVFVWSIGNEISEQWSKDAADTSGRAIARELASIVRQLDDRPITSANNEVNPSNNLILSGALDLIGYNYNHDKFDKFHETYPGKKLIASETVSALQTRGHYDMPSDSMRIWPTAWDKPLLTGNADLSCSAYDNCRTPWGSTHEETMKVFTKYDHVSGMFIWTGFDYLGEPTPYPWPARSSYFGIIDLAGFPKDVYYMYQSQWTDKPVLHVFPHWNWKAGQTVDVWAYYNNADEVELLLNGRSLGVRKKDTDQFHVVWRVPFEAGTLKAISRKDGKLVLTKEVSTAGKAAKIILTADRSKIKANGEDLSFITAKIVDANGNMVPDADNELTFKVDGEAFIAAVDNGSPTSMESFKADHRKVFNGLALAILQAKNKTGKVTFTATADGLPTTSLQIELN
ncbi:glycoside hydrolase family 2 [Solitalea longa]|uniref:Glycoside hydrolase family 2 n=1 Tax=Solitalea longa TaxID=2079460 RepID=A0A2S5A4E8_9SPHI|nr:beta-galactosidase GalB [Solitalea longa]POY37461.1 glycoside hydrolase family 2 [Solitalea longa]